MKQHAPFLYVLFLLAMMGCEASSPPQLPPFTGSGADSETSDEQAADAESEEEENSEEGNEASEEGLDAEEGGESEEDSDVEEGGETGTDVDAGEGEEPEEGGDAEEGGEPEEGGDAEEGGDPEEGGDAEEGGDPEEGGDAEEGGDPEEGGDAEEGGESEEGGDAEEGGEPEEGGDAEEGGDPDEGGDAEEGGEPGECEGGCFPDQVPGACESFACVDGLCVVLELEDGQECAGDDLCFDEFVCQEGLCTGSTPSNCSDGNPCTTDTCDSTLGCSSENNSDACDDGDVCTVNDQCQNGNCGGDEVENCGCVDDSDCIEFDDDNLCNGKVLCTGGGQCQLDLFTVVNCPASEEECTVNTCDPSSGECILLIAENGTTCDDGDPCTIEDSCGDTGCTGVDSSDCGCQSDADCADLEDGNLCNGTLICNSGGECIVSPSTIVTCEDKGNSCLTTDCEPETGACVDTYLPGASPCDDGDECTIADACFFGQCIPSASLDCEDENPCTQEQCDPGQGCVYTPVTTGLPCEDGSALTVGDVCLFGECQSGDVLNCDDDDPCTTDVGDELLGCVNTPNSDPCDDGTACTVDDTCAGGECLGTELVCADGDTCTEDSCDSATGCVNQPKVGGFCDDGDACTLGDICDENGGCAGSLPLVCDDGNICTTDSCDSEQGCVTAAEAGTCDDGDSCTLEGNCVEGACQAGLPVSCDDGNVCTDDSCDPDTGCVYASNSATCDDGNACTSGDFCTEGVCGGSTGTLTCEDDGECTSSSCDPASGCVVSALVGAACDDGDSCTEADSCGESGLCDVSSPKNCEDGNPCTTDECNPNLGCTSFNNNDDCDDGDSCTSFDQCSFGKCYGGQNSCQCVTDADCVAFDDGNACNGVTFCDVDAEFGPQPNVCRPNPNTEITCDGSGDTGCLSNQCVPETGECILSAVPAGSSCDDGLSCTTLDACEGDTCAGTALVCNDGDPCTSDACDEQQGCVYTPEDNPCDDGNLCTTNDGCSEGVCAGSVDGAVCDDSNPCTIDNCSPVTGCSSAVNPGNACPADDACSGSGVCQEDGSCGSGAPVDCNDGNPCTDDSCDPVSGCAHVSTSGAFCDDGDACTLGDTCAEGACVGEGASCDDDDPCTLDECVGEDTCAHTLTPNAPCDDGDVCDLNDVCSEDGECTGGTAVVCDDGDDCTDDSCDAVTGCAFVPTTVNTSCPNFDGDNDGIFGEDDNCPLVANADQLNTDETGPGDMCAYACIESGDMTLVQSQQISDTNVYACLGGCEGDKLCVANCVNTNTGATVACAACYVGFANCKINTCGELCPEGQATEECNTCVKEQCESVLTQCIGLGVAEGENGCPEGTNAYCDGTCWPDAWWSEKLGDGNCDEILNCEAWSEDNGDCDAGGVCGPDNYLNCYDACVAKVDADPFLGNGTCDPDYNCEGMGFDGGDCAAACGDSQLEDCQGGCIPVDNILTQVGTGVCQFEYYCAAYEYDQGDCGPAPFVCTSEQLPDCSGACAEESAIAAAVGNGVCEPFVSCFAWASDGGDCVDAKCTEPNDLLYFQYNGLSDLSELLADCYDECEGEDSQEEVGTCLQNCIQDEAELSNSCTTCAMDAALCTQVECGLQCQASGTLCDLCVEENCTPDLLACIGYTVED